MLDLAIISIFATGSCSMDHDAYAYISEHPLVGLIHQCFVWFCGPYVRKLIFGRGKAGKNFQT